MISAKALLNTPNSVAPFIEGILYKDHLAQDILRLVFYHYTFLSEELSLLEFSYGFVGEVYGSPPVHHGPLN